MRSTTARGWAAFGLATAALVWGLLLFPWALFSPAYRGERCEALPGGTGGCTSTSDTLVGVNGPGVLVWVALPALVAALAWLTLHRACARGSRRSINAAWTLVLALFAFSFVTGFSIGLFVLPVPLLLAASAFLTDR